MRKYLKTVAGLLAPTKTFPGLVWADLTNNVLKMRNAADNAWLGVDTDTTLVAEGTPVDGVQATLLADSAAANADLTFTCVEYGNATHSEISIQILAGAAGTTLGVTVDDGLITIQLAEGGNTATQVKTAYDAVAAATALATVAVEGTGAGAVDAMPATGVAGGVNVTAGPVGSLLRKSDGTVLYVKVSAQVWKKVSLAAL